MLNEMFLLQTSQRLTMKYAVKHFLFQYKYVLNLKKIIDILDFL